MKRKIISLILFCTLILGCIPSFAAEKEQNVILASEQFESYAENSTKYKTFEALSGVDTRVLSDGGNKVLFSRAFGESVILRHTVQGDLGENTVISAKLKFSGSNLNGEIFKIKDKKGNSLKLINVQNGLLKLFDGKKFGGAPKDHYKTITVVINWRKQRFDIYKDKKCVLSDWPMPAGSGSFAVSGIEIGLNFEESESAVYVDDFRVYQGSVLPWEMSFPAETASDEVLDFTPTENVNTKAEILTSLKFDRSMTGVGGVNVGDGPFTFQHKVDEDGNGMVNFYCDDKSDGKLQFDITEFGNVNADTGRFVLDYKLRVNKLTGGAGIHMLDSRAPQNWVTSAYINLNAGPTLSCAKGTLGGMTEGEWTRISVAFDALTGFADMYINGIYKHTVNWAEGAYPARFRFDATSPAGGTLDVDMDYVMLYTGRRVLSEEELFPPETSLEVGAAANTIMDPYDKLSLALKDRQIFMTVNNTKFVDGKKIDCSGDTARARIIDSTLMIPVSDVEYLGDLKAEYTEANGEIKIGDAILKIGSDAFTLKGAAKKLNKAPLLEDGIAYVPLKGVAEQIFGKKVTWDNRGFAVVAQSVVDTVSDFKFLDRYIQWYPIDLIWRYMFYDNPTGAKVIEDVKKTRPGNEHPRIVYTEEDVKYIREKIKVDDEWKRVGAKTVAEGENALKTDTESYKVANDTTARNACNALLQLSKAYVVTGDTKYASKGVDIMKALSTWDREAAFQYNYNFAWGFLCAGLAWGIDCFYDYMQSTESGRADFKTIKDGIVKNIIFYDFIANYTGAASNLYTLRLQDNFVGLFAGGMTMLCLALCDEPDLEKDCEYLVENILKTFEVAADILLPDGGYSESIGYGGLHLTYIGEALAALWNCCGDDYNLGMSPGLLKAGAAFSKLQSVNHGAGYHDGGSRTNYTEDQIRCLQAYRYGNVTDAQMYRNRNINANVDFSLTNLFWYSKAIDKLGYVPNVMHVELDYWTRSAGTGAFINDRRVSEPVFAAYHGGWTGITHDMLDLGSFVFEADNFMWATDLGQGNYNVGNYWAHEGYNVYKKNPQGENCLVINPTKYPEGYYGQTIGVYADRIKHESKPRGAYAVLDLSEAYSMNVSDYKRGYYFGDNRNTYTVQDELTLTTKDAELYWFMQTGAEVEILSNTKARLTRPDKRATLTLDVYCSVPGYKLEVGPAVPLEGTVDVPNQDKTEGYSRFAIHIPKANGDVKIAVKLSPDSSSAPYKEVEFIPMDKWSIPDGEIQTPPTFTSVMMDGKLIEGYGTGIRTYNIVLPFGSTAVPQITATSDFGTVSVNQAKSLDEPTTVTISAEGFAPVVCRVNYEISFDREIKVTDAISSAVSEAGLKGELITPKSAWAQSNITDAQRPVNMVDGVFSTTFAQGEVPAYVEIDLGSIHDIKGVAAAYLEGDRRKVKFDLLYSEDGINFKKVLSECESTGETDSWESIHMPGRVRYIRMIGYGNNLNSWFNVAELAAYK